MLTWQTINQVKYLVSWCKSHMQSYTHIYSELYWHLWKKQKHVNNISQPLICKSPKFHPDPYFPIAQTTPACRLTSHLAAVLLVATASLKSNKCRARTASRTQPLAGEHGDFFMVINGIDNDSEKLDNVWFMMAKPRSNRAYWRKFRRQTSDTMDRWKSRGGKSQRREEQKREDQRRERERRKKMQVRKKVAKSRNTVCFPSICGSGESKSRLAKAAGAEPCGQMRDEQLYAVVARSTFRSQNVQNTPCSEHFWKLRCRTSARRCGAKHIWNTKCTKHDQPGNTFGSWHVVKVHTVVAWSTFTSQKC